MIGIAAQVSLYPLATGQQAEELSPAIDEAIQTLQAHALDVQPGAMSTVVAGDDAAVFAALQEAFRRACERGPMVMVVTLSNACPVPGTGESAGT